MKNGIASSGNESSPVTDFWASIIIGMSDVINMAMHVESPRVMPMGMLSAIVTIRMEKRIIASMVPPPIPLSLPQVMQVRAGHFYAACRIRLKASGT